MGRFYEIKGKKYPSVTTILNIIGKPWLGPWYAKLEREHYEKVLRAALEARGRGRTKVLTEALERGKGKAADLEVQQAARLGTEVHNAVDKRIKSLLGEKIEEPALSPQAAKCFEAWWKWWESKGLRPLAAEQTVYSEKYGYAGTLDLYAESPKGKRIVLDWKTSRAVYPEFFLQNIAYRVAADERGLPSEKGAVVQIPKDGNRPKIAMVPRTVLFEDFLAAFTLWKWNQSHRKW